MKAVINLEKELIDKITSEIRDGEFSSANDFINHALMEYFKMKNEEPDELPPDIDEVFKRTVKSKNRDDGGVIMESSPMAIPRFQRRTYDFQEDLHLELSDLEKISKMKKKDDSIIQPIHNSGSMIFGQINRFLAVKSALYITGNAIKLRNFEPLHYTDDIVKHLSSAFAMRVSNLRPDVSTIFKTNIGISLPKMGEKVDELSQQKSLNRFTTQYMWNIRRGDKKVDGILASLVLSIW